MRSQDILNSLILITSLRLLGAAFFIFPLATAIFLLLNHSTLFREGLFVVDAIICALLMVINRWGTNRIKKADGQVSFSRVWEFSFWKKSPLVVGFTQTALYFISIYFLLSFLTDLDGILLLAYGIIGYISSITWGYTTKNISFWGIISTLYKESSTKRTK